MSTQVAAQPTLLSTSFLTMLFLQLLITVYANFGNAFFLTCAIKLYSISHVSRGFRLTSTSGVHLTAGRDIIRDFCCLFIYLSRTGFSSASYFSGHNCAFVVGRATILSLSPSLAQVSLYTPSYAVFFYCRQTPFFLCLTSILPHHPGTLFLYHSGW